MSTYEDLLIRIWHHGYNETNVRTGVKIKALKTPFSFQLDMEHGLPVFGNRRYYPHVAAAELAWMIAGTKNPALVMEYAPKLWGKFIEDGEIKSAYGWRWAHEFGRNQLEEAVNALRADKTDRQCYVQAWDPRVDGNGRKNSKNVPCPVGFSINVIDDRLNMTLFIRSSDTVIGLPYDVMVYSLLLDAIGASMGVKPGVLHVTLAHAHYYEPQFPIVQKLLEPHCSRVNQRMNLPSLPLDVIYKDPHFYIAHVKRLALQLKPHSYDPKPEVVV